MSVNDDGEIRFFDETGAPLSEGLIRTAKRQQGDKIMGLIHEKCAEINGVLQQLAELHLHTPSPDLAGSYTVAEFEESAPSQPKRIKPSLFAKIFPPLMKKVEKTNAKAEVAYRKEMAEWLSEKEAFDCAEHTKKEKLEVGVLENVSIMGEVLDDSFQSIIWPRETLVSTEFNDKGTCVFVDVDLPEIEDMPNRKATVPARGYKLNVKEISEAQLRKAYMQHVHSIGFRIIGEVFATLPNAALVVLSAYSQRNDPSTGNVIDEYLYSVQVPKAGWEEINFNKLRDVDPVEALGGFDIRRKMTKTGIFKAITPFDPCETEGVK